MTENKFKRKQLDLKALFSKENDGLKDILREVVQEVLEQEMTEAIGAGKSERSQGRLGYRSGYYERSLITRVGKLELRVPQDRQGHFWTQVFERYQRSDRSLAVERAKTGLSVV